MNRLSRTYRKWTSMVQRCTNPKHERWKYYGGRGIEVCKRWRKYANFLADMGEAPPGLWLDRIDNSKGYEPGNCRWVTPLESATNRRPRAQIPGSLRQLARAAGLDYLLVYQRHKVWKWPLDLALRTPKLRRGHHRPQD